MMRVRPCEEPNACGGAKRSSPSTRVPRRARWNAAALPIAPRPAMTTSYVLWLRMRLPCVEGLTCMLVPRCIASGDHHTRDGTMRASSHTIQRETAGNGDIIDPTDELQELV